MPNYELRLAIRQILSGANTIYMSAAEISEAMRLLTPPLHYSAQQIANSIRLLPEICSDDYQTIYDQDRHIHLYRIIQS